MRTTRLSLGGKVMKNACKKILSLAIAGWLLGFAAPAAADPFAYVTNVASNDVSVIDTATNSVVATSGPMTHRRMLCEN